MEPIGIAILALAVGLIVGSLIGRSTGRSSGLKAGHAKGLRAGREEARRLEEERKAADAEEEGNQDRYVGYARGLSEGRDQGAATAREELEQRLRTVISAIRQGRTPDAVPDGSVEADLKSALLEGWAPRESERQAALREAVGRVSAFLKANVREPLVGATPESDADELRERIVHALGALQDLDFFTAEIDSAREGTDLSKLSQNVSREFAADQDVPVRLQLSPTPVRAEVNGQALMDALYLVLHNAGRFGDGGTIDLTVGGEGARAFIRVRDRGPGFSEEAFKRAFDVFYSTSTEGLGLGLPHARRVIEEMGGKIELRNVPDGGAEVEISFPVS